MEAQTSQRAKVRNHQPLEVASNPAALLTLPTVRTLTSLSRSGIYRRMAERTFPQAVKLSSRCVAGAICGRLATSMTCEHF